MNNTKYGKCEGCRTLTFLRRVGTLDPDKLQTKVMLLCRTCEPKYLHLNREARRALERNVRSKPKTRRHPPDDAPRQRLRAKAAEKRRSDIVVPSQEPEKTKTETTERRSKGGLILP